MEYQGGNNISLYCIMLTGGARTHQEALPDLILLCSGLEVQQTRLSTEIQSRE